jgi:hypothetical protein
MSFGLLQDYEVEVSWMLQFVDVCMTSCRQKRTANLGSPFGKATDVDTRSSRAAQWEEASQDDLSGL